MRIYKIAKEVLIFVNLLLTAVILIFLVYSGTALMSRLGDIGDTPPAIEVPLEDAPTEAPTGGLDEDGCEEGQSFSSETGLCYPDGE